MEEKLMKNKVYGNTGAPVTEEGVTEAESGIKFGGGPARFTNSGTTKKTEYTLTPQQLKEQEMEEKLMKNKVYGSTGAPAEGDATAAAETDTSGIKFGGGPARFTNSGAGKKTEIKLNP